jgi:branched-chain amino acid transport system ATP-binding protein
MTDLVIEIERLNAFYGELHILHDITLQARKKEVVALLGRNGAGKTTLLKSIMGIGPRRDGVVKVKGELAVKMPPHRIARLGIAYCPEERGIFSGLTVRENLLLPPVLKPGGLSLEEIYELFPNLQERHDSLGTQLSGGEQQMLAVARILRSGADTLLLDEPSEGLAPTIVKQIAHLVLRLKKHGFTILLVEQNLSFSKALADRYYVIDSGAIVGEFEREQVKKNSSQIESYLAL